MSIDAALTCLGPARVWRWTCESDAGYESARQAETALVTNIEHAIAEQLGSSVAFPEGLVQEEEESIPQDAERVLPIGNLGGLEWAQEVIRAQMLRDGEQTPPELVHLLDHAPDAGLYIPVMFPVPFIVDDRGEAVSVGSLQGLRQALHIWRQRGEPLHRGLDVYRAHLELMCEQALEYGLALELI